MKETKPPVPVLQKIKKPSRPWTYKCPNESCDRITQTKGDLVFHMDKFGHKKEFVLRNADFSKEVRVRGETVQVNHLQSRAA